MDAALSRLAKHEGQDPGADPPSGIVPGGIEVGSDFREVESSLGPPDRIFVHGTVWQGSARSNRWPVWVYHAPRHRGFLTVLSPFPYLRFKCGLDNLYDAWEGGLWGLKSDSFLLQMGDDGRVRRIDGWD